MGSLPRGTERGQQLLGFPIGVAVAGLSFLLPWWGSLLLIAGAWLIGILGSGDLAYGIGSGGAFPFGVLFIFSGLPSDLVALVGVTMMGALLLLSGRAGG